MYSLYLFIILIQDLSFWVPDKLKSTGPLNIFHLITLLSHCFRNLANREIVERILSRGRSEKDEDHRLSSCETYL